MLAPAPPRRALGLVAVRFYVLCKCCCDRPVGPRRGDLDSTYGRAYGSVVNCG